MSDPFVAVEGDETISKYVVDIETSLANEGGEHEAALSLLKPFDRRREPSEWDLRFMGEDKCVHWCKETFYEESIVQISFSLLGPLCWPWAIKLCGIDGLKITMFWPSKHEDGSSGVGLFWMQVIFGFGMQTPTLVGAILALTGNLPLYPESSILPFSHLYIPLMVLVVRQIVIAVKYAFVPRRRMRRDRSEGRSFINIGDDMLGAWCATPSNESMARQLDMAMWRVGLTGNEILRFTDDVPEEVLRLIDLPETTPKKGDDASVNMQNVLVKGGEGSDASGAAVGPGAGSEGTKHCVPASNPRPRNELPLRTVVKYAAFVGTQKVKNSLWPMFLCLVGCITFPLVFLGINGKPLFGSNHVEKYFCSVGFMMLMMSIAPNLVGFCMVSEQNGDRQTTKTTNNFSLFTSSPMVLSGAQHCLRPVPIAAAPLLRAAHPVESGRCKKVRAHLHQERFRQAATARAVDPEHPAVEQGSAGPAEVRGILPQTRGDLHGDVRVCPCSVGRVPSDFHFRKAVC